MICFHCQNPASAELIALCKRVVCLSCATAIAEALPLLKTQPSRRHAICMRLQENGVRVMAASQQVKDLAEWGITDEQITGACDIAKERNGFATFGYVYGILKNERERNNRAPVVSSGGNEPSSGGKAIAPVVKEDWERLGFANQADYERWQFAYDKDRRSGRRITEAEHRRNWLSPAI